MVAPVPALLALSVIGFGVLIYRHAYAITRFGEQLDAVGSTTTVSEVEPRTWNVLLTKGVAFVCFVLGGLLLFGALVA